VPKTDAGIRDVAIPPHLMPKVKDHLSANITGGREGLLVPAADGVTHLAPSTLYGVYYPARAQAARPDLRFHDLRHTGAVLAASTGATLAELMARLGHSTAGAAMRYQHASQDRDQVIAAAPVSPGAAVTVEPEVASQLSWVPWATVPRHERIREGAPRGPDHHLAVRERPNLGGPFVVRGEGKASGRNTH